ncbi:MAG: Mur ligase family protein [Rhodothermales bacterium]
MTWPEAEALLLDLPRFADQGSAAFKPGLERMHALLDAAGNPHERFRSVHVAGTNGKGSTASLVASIATAAGLRVGLHTSPHLHDLAERLRLDGVPAPHGWIADAVARLGSAFVATEPSFFEATVALSFLYFAEMDVDLAVIEVGLGGRLDATNVLRPDLALITHIGLDHADLLGDTLEAVAREKAGIAKPGVPLLTAAEGDGVAAAIRETAEARGATFVRVQDEVDVGRVDVQPDRLVMDLTTPMRTYAELEIGLPGRHQVWNAALAVRAAEHVVAAAAHDAAPIYEGLLKVRKHSGLTGRCELLCATPLILSDVAHNADGLRASLAFAGGLRRGQLHVLFGTMRDKDLHAMTDGMVEGDVIVLPVPLPSSRAVPLRLLREALLLRGLRVVDVGGVREGIDWFVRHAGAADSLLVTGSHLTVAAARTALGTRSTS